MSGTFDDWEKDAVGHLKVWPLLGFSTAVFAADAGGVRLEIGNEPPTDGEPVPALQLVLRREQLQQLGEALIEAAAQVESLSVAGNG